MLILDTDHISEYQRGTSPAAVRLEQRLAATNESYGITIISLEEIMRGWMAAIRRSNDSRRQIAAYERLQKLFQFFATWTVLPWNKAATLEFDSLRQSKVRVGTMDLKIAAICLANDATLLSRNKIDFGKVARLRTEDWLS